MDIAETKSMLQTGKKCLLRIVNDERNSCLIGQKYTKYYNNNKLLYCGISNDVGETG